MYGRPGAEHDRCVLTLLCILAVCLFGGCGGLSPGGSSESAATEGVYPPNGVIEGLTYGQWGDAWWQWFLSVPVDRNPVFDETGALAGEAQPGPVWFLAGTTGTESERTCTVPAGTPIFFPIVTFAGWIPTDGATLDELRQAASSWIDYVAELEVIVDGVSLRGLQNYRFQSDSSFVFVGPRPEDCFAPAQDGPHEAFSDGYWVMLRPLAPGQHELHFRGKIVFPGNYPNSQVFEPTVTYHLTVQ